MTGAGSPSPTPPGDRLSPKAAALQARRDTLARELADLQWDLGGLAYEMAIRDHFRLDLLVHQAARLQEVDARLAEIEHLLRLERAGAAGACPNCGTLYAAGAVFCSQCAFQLAQPPAPEAQAPAAPAPEARPAEELSRG